MIKIQMPKAYVHLLAAEISLACDRAFDESKTRRSTVRGPDVAIARQRKVVQALWDFESPAFDDSVGADYEVSLERAASANRSLWVIRLDRFRDAMVKITAAEGVVRCPLSLKAIHQLFRRAIGTYNKQISKPKDDANRLYINENNNVIVTAKTINHAKIFGGVQGQAEGWAVCTNSLDLGEAAHMSRSNPNVPFVHLATRWVPMATQLAHIPYIDL